jgi:hypothetical protein
MNTVKICPSYRYLSNSCNLYAELVHFTLRESVSEDWNIQFQSEIHLYRVPRCLDMNPLLTEIATAALFAVIDLANLRRLQIRRRQ